MQVGHDGIRFHWLHTQKRNYQYRGSNWFPWSMIQNVSLIADASSKRNIQITLNLESAKISLADFWYLYVAGLIKNTNFGVKLVIEPEAIVHKPDQTKLAAAFQHFLPGEQIDSSMAGLEPISYTKLWLNEFSDAEQANFPSNLLDPLPSGTKLAGGRFCIIERLGSGGQSLTYKATMPGAVTKDRNGTQPLERGAEERVVVLKEFVLPVRAGREIKSRALQHIENEAKLLQQLNHPQIVKYIDSFISGNRAYLCIDYIKGATLRQLVESQGPIPESEVIRIALSMCSILEYLHGLDPPVIHRDFTPENLLLPGDEKVVLIDFNVAQQQESESTKTVVGKHHYLPPEQFRGNAVPQSDIYACGGCIFWLCTGQDPEPLSISHPKNVRDTVSPELDAIIAKATALQLTERYASVSELKKDLAAL